MQITLGELRQLIREYSDNGCRYEGSVIKTLRLAGVAGHMKRAACSDASRPDADIKVDGDYFYVEVKSNSRAQMGGGSVGYSLADRKFFATGANRELSQMIVDILNGMNDTSLHKGLKSLLLHLSKASGKTITDIPMSGFSAQAWDDAKNFGLLQAINRTFQSDMSVIANHYARKDTFYIQIGGAGFFRLGEANPANLPVPVLSGKVSLEVRVAKSGDTGNVSKAGMRVQARLIASASSPYTLDDPESVKKLISDREGQSKAPTRRRAG